MRNPARILIVEDNPDGMEIMRARLDALGYEVITAYDGQEGLAVALERLPDLILLDVMMPKMDGYQVCKALKAVENTKDIPVIFVTALNEVKDEARGFKLGAADFITKPISPPILHARVKTHLALKRNYEALQEAYSIIEAQKSRMQDELEVGRRIQMNMLPGEFPPFPHRKEISLFASLNPAFEVGGDLYDYFLIDDNRLCFCIGDVSGKGVPAALFMAATQTLLESKGRDATSTASIVNHINAQLVRKNEAFMFVTLFLAILDLATGEMNYTNAGHNPPCLLRQGRTPEVLHKTHGPPVGNLDGMQWQEDSMNLHPGDILLLYTDGVTEACNENGELFGIERLISTLESSEDEVEQIISQVSSAISKFVADETPVDDITMLAIKFHG